MSIVSGCSTSRRSGSAGLALAGLLLSACSGPSPAVVNELPTATAGAPAVTGEAALTLLNELGGLCETFTESDDPIWGRQQINDLRAALRALGPEPEGPPAVDATQLRARLGQELLRFDARGAAEELATARAAVRDLEIDAPWVRDVWWLSALAHLRQAQAANCNPSQGQRGCLIPLDGQGGYANLADVETADEMLETFLGMNPDARFGVTARYLLNVTRAMLGRYPEGVPAELRMDLIGAAGEARPMAEVAAALGVNTLDIAGGAVMEDFDGDGLLDLVTSTMDTCDELKFYRNEGDGTFSDRTIASGLAGQPATLALHQADFDNDGHVDLFLPRGAWLFASGRLRRSLLRNNGDGTFTDVAVAAGLAEPAYPSQVGAWGDYDNDGDLDLFVGNEEAGPGQPYPNQLFRNNGDGTFTDVAEAAGVRGSLMTKGAAWGDFDNDGDLDLYVSNFGANSLYRNNGDGTFSDVAGERGVIEPTGRSFSTWFWDYDNDGWLDLMVNVTAQTVDLVAAGMLQAGDRKNHPRLYRNLGGQGFEDVTAAAGLDQAMMVMGANYGDLDNDGFPDMYLGTGGPGYEVILPNRLFRNDGAGGFREVTVATGTGLLGKGHGIAWGDLDNDGDQDIYAQLGGMFPGDRSYDAVFLNPGYGNRWITLRLVGTQSNRYGVGARLRATVRQPDGRREIHALAGTGGSFGANSLQVEMGLGQAEALEALEIWWPTSDSRQVFRDLPLDRIVVVTEGQETPRLLPPAPLRLAGD